MKAIVHALVSATHLILSVIYYDPVTSTLLAHHIHPGNKPTLPELLKFKIPEKISIKYFQFGTFLLDDTDGSRVETVAHKHSNDAERINIEVLKQWLTGRGKQPVTWAILVEVLRDIKLSTLADDIEAIFKCPSRLVSEDLH